MTEGAVLELLEVLDVEDEADDEGADDEDEELVTELCMEVLFFAENDGSGDE